MANSPELRLRLGDQPLPVKNDRPFIHDIIVADLRREMSGHLLLGGEVESVVADIEARKALGISRYGVALQPFNGRDCLRDAYEELLDAAAYTRQAMVEAKSPAAHGVLDSVYLLLLVSMLSVRKLRNTPGVI